MIKLFNELIDMVDVVSQKEKAKIKADVPDAQALEKNGLNKKSTEKVCERPPMKRGVSKMDFCSLYS